MKAQPRIALVTTQALDGPPSGARIRLEATASALGRLGELAVFPINVIDVTDGTASVQPPNAVRLVRLSKARYVRWLLSGRLPPHLAGYVDTIDIAGLLDFEPDLVWFRPTIASHVVRWPPRTAVVIDVDDLEGSKDAHRRAARSASASAARRLFDRFAGWRVRRTWGSHYRALRRRGAWLVACSKADAELVQGWTAPNGYPLPASPASDPKSIMDARLVFVGRLTYAPNRDCMDEIVGAMWPSIRARVPSASLTVVGAGHERWNSRTVPSGIEFVGEVDDLEAYLTNRLATIIPLRSGGGTRLKVLEAFAHRIPVVATDVAVEGLDCVPDVHYLRAETADDFGRAIQRLLDDVELRCRLASAAHDLVQEQFGRTRSIESIVEIAHQALAAYRGESTYGCG